MLRIRRHAEALGYSLVGFTDAEIEQGVHRWAQATKAVGITTIEAFKAFGRVAVLANITEQIEQQKEGQP